LVYGREEPHWARFFGGIADQVVRSLGPQRVFDAGCAHGFLLEALHDRDVHVRGRDISQFAVSKVSAKVRPFVELGSIADPIEGTYDLVTCIEVLEHMTEDDALHAIAAMAAVAPRLLFSSSPDDFDEPTHINVKPVIWWLCRFAEAGMVPVADYDASFVTSHAYLLERSGRGVETGELLAFADLIRWRMLTQKRRRRLGVLLTPLAPPLRCARRLLRRAASRSYILRGAVRVLWSVSSRLVRGMSSNSATSRGIKPPH
jgi:SAM-dependent methyltransferase